MQLVSLPLQDLRFIEDILEKYRRSRVTKIAEANTLSWKKSKSMHKYIGKLERDLEKACVLKNLFKRHLIEESEKLKTKKL